MKQILRECNTILVFPGMFLTLHLAMSTSSSAWTGWAVRTCRQSSGLLKKSLSISNSTSPTKKHRN